MCERPAKDVEPSSGDPQPLESELEIAARALGVAEEALRARRALLEGGELRREHATAPPRLPPQANRAGDDEHERGEAERETDEEAPEHHRGRS